jgi:hypothetical protein
MLVGYARTSTAEQEAGFAAQERDLKGAGCERLFSEQVPSVAQRLQLAAALDFVRDGDKLIVTRLDRLARGTPGGPHDVRDPVGNNVPLQRARSNSQTRFASMEGCEGRAQAPNRPRQPHRFQALPGDFSVRHDHDRSICRRHREFAGLRPGLPRAMAATTGSFAR